MKEPEMSDSLQTVVALQSNSQHQSDKLCDRPRVTDMPETYACTETTTMKKKKS